MDKPLNDCISEYKSLLKKGDIQKAYRGLLKYISELKNYFTNKYPEEFVIGQLHQGYMDVTYFTLTTKLMKSKKLKVVIFFDHERMSFSICLAGQNKQIQEKYWEIIKDKGISRYTIPSTAKDVIIKSVLIENPDFNNLNSLTKQIEDKAISFIEDVTDILD